MTIAKIQINAAVAVILISVVSAQTEIYRTRRLQSEISYCRNSMTCPPKINEELVIKFCEYTVPANHSYKCCDGEVGTRLEFMTPQLWCEAGYFASPKVDEFNSDDIVVYKKPCAPDSYQPEPSGCYDACHLKHNLLGWLENLEKFKVFSQGNNVYPAKAYCNFEDGYYSADGTDFLDYNDRFKSVYENFCKHVNDSNPCTEGLVPLHNKTCVFRCRPGYARDVHDNFLCKRTNGSDASLEQNDEGRRTTEKSTERNTERSSGIVTQATAVNEKTSTDMTRFWIIGGTVGGAVFTIAIAILVTCMYVKHRRHNYQKANIKDPEGAGQHPFKKDTDDTLCQSMVSSLENQMKSVGALVQNGNLMGTVFMVGKDLVITAWHVVQPIIDPDNTGQSDESRLSADKVLLIFNECLIGIPAKTYTIGKIIWKNVNLDTVLLRIANPGDNLPRSLILWPHPMSALKLTDVSFVGYGHPKNPNKKKLDPRCWLLDANSARIRSALAWLLRKKKTILKLFSRYGKSTDAVELGYYGYDKEEIFLFDCYVEEGSSGAPALTNNNASSIKVVGMLTHGFPKFHHELKHFHDKEECPRKYRFEKAVKMEYIYSYMEREINDPEIRGQLFPSS